MRISRKLLLSASTVVTALCAPGFAQEGAPRATGTSETEIVVTATRRAENLQDVPLSVTAVSAETLEARNITDIGRLDVVTPGFSYGRSGIDSRPAMRDRKSVV